MDIFEKLRNMKVLLIDDDEWIRDSLTLFFEGEGCHLLAVATAEEGIEVLKSQPYDIIICDYKLPGMNGLGFFTQIKNSHPEVMKIMITAYGNEEVASEAEKLGVQKFIRKPLTAEAIDDSLATLIEKYENKNANVRGKG